MSFPLLFVSSLLIVGTRLNKLLGDVVISQGGVVPFILPEVRVLLYAFDVAHRPL